VTVEQAACTAQKVFIALDLIEIYLLKKKQRKKNKKSSKLLSKDLKRKTTLSKQQKLK